MANFETFEQNEADFMVDRPFSENETKLPV